MEVILRTKQKKAVERYVGANRRYEHWLRLARPQLQDSWCVTMPAIAWLRTRETMAGKLFGPLGGRGTSTGSEQLALQRVARALALLNRHPALSWVALPGNHPDVFPVWGTTDDDKLSPYPMMGRPFGVLWPEFCHLGGIQVTRWHLDGPVGDSPLLKEEEHLAFGIYQGS